MACLFLILFCELNYTLSPLWPTIRIAFTMVYKIKE